MTSKERREKGMLFLTDDNLCRVIRAITEDDRKYYFKDREIDKETMKKICG